MIDELFEDEEQFLHWYPNLELSEAHARRDCLDAAVELLAPESDDQRLDLYFLLLDECNRASSPYLDSRHSAFRRQLIRLDEALGDLDRVLANLNPELLAEVCWLTAVEPAPINKRRFRRQGRGIDFDLERLQKIAQSCLPELVCILATRCRSLLQSFPPKQDGRPPHFRKNFLLFRAVWIYEEDGPGEVGSNDGSFATFADKLYEFCTGEEGADLEEVIKRAIDNYEPIPEADSENS